jgi:hypothetical protein
MMANNLRLGKVADFAAQNGQYPTQINVEVECPIKHFNQFAYIYQFAKQSPRNLSEMLQ